VVANFQGQMFSRSGVMCMCCIYYLYYKLFCIVLQRSIYIPLSQMRVSFVGSKKNDIIKKKKNGRKIGSPCNNAHNIGLDV